MIVFVHLDRLHGCKTRGRGAAHGVLRRQRGVRPIRRRTNVVHNARRRKLPEGESSTPLQTIHLAPQYLNSMHPSDLFSPVSYREVPGIGILRSTGEVILKVLFGAEGDFENPRSEFPVSAFLKPGKKGLPPPPFGRGSGLGFR